MKHCGRMTKSVIPDNYFSEKTLSHLKPQQGLSERYQRRALDVTLACKLTHAYGKYHLAMLHRQLAMSEEDVTDLSLAICLPEVPSLDVMVETDAVGAAKLGQDFHDFVLLFRCNHIITMMDSVVGAIASAEGRAYKVSGFSLVPVR